MSSNTQVVVTDEKHRGTERYSESSLTSSTEHALSHREGKAAGLDADADVEFGLPVIDPTEDKDTKDTREHADLSDPNVVGWDSADDPDICINWPAKKKWSNFFMVSCVCFLTPLASSMTAPAVPLIMREFGTASETIGAFIVSIYILGYAVGPLVIAPMSELYGRLPLYHACNFMFVIWNVACALSPNVGALLAFRFLAGIAGSCPITIGAGSIADSFRTEKRGGAMAIFAMGPLLGPVIGPVAGGYLAQAAGWRWIFWVITIAGGLFLGLSLVLMKETYEPVLLQRRVNRLKKETGNMELRSKLAPTITQKEYFKRSIIRPTKMLILSPIVAVFSIYMAIVYGYLYLLFTTLTLVYEYEYHFSQGSVGLTYLGIGIGSLSGLVIFGILSDKILKHMTAKNGGVTKPEFRLPPLIPASLLIPIGLFWYGWSAEKHIHWIMPIIGTGFVGFGMLATFMPIQTYMVDSFTVHAASAIAATTVLRSLMGAFLPLAGPKMYQKLGLGWGNSLLGFIALALVPLTFVFYFYGERIRTSSRFRVSF